MNIDTGSKQCLLVESLYNCDTIKFGDIVESYSVVR